MATLDAEDLAAIAALLAEVKAKTDTIGALAVTVTSPVAASGTITVYRADSYPAARSRAVTATVADATHVMALDDHATTVQLRCTQATWAAADVTSTVDGWTLTWEPTRVQTDALTRQRQTYQIVALYDDSPDDESTLAEGTLVVKAKISPLV